MVNCMIIICLKLFTWHVNCINAWLCITGKFDEEIAANLLTQKRMKITGAELAANSKPRRW